MDNIYLKVLTSYNGVYRGPFSGFDFNNYLPLNNMPGKWLPRMKNLWICQRGYHVTDIDSLYIWRGWNPGTALFVVETAGEHHTSRNKSAWETMRFLEEIDTLKFRGSVFNSASCYKPGARRLVQSRIDYWKNTLEMK